MAPIVTPSLVRRVEALLAALTFRLKFLSSHEHRNLSYFLPPQKVSAPPLSTHPVDSSTKIVKGAYATFISKDEYLPGALVLAYCHQVVKSKYPFIILATSSLSEHARSIIKRAGITLVDIERLVPAREQYDPSVTDARFRETWTKLR
jgi:hypothetical protein